MDQWISLITFGVADLARAREFCARIGWRGQEIQEPVFFRAGGLGWRCRARGSSPTMPEQPCRGSPPSGVTLAHNVRTREEVDAILAKAQAAGATIRRPAAETFYGGHAGHFADPDGHSWEVAYNPGFPLAEDGSLTIPELCCETA